MDKSISATPPSPIPPQRVAGSPDDALPPVEAPSMVFVVQLFLIPLLIVSTLVFCWLGLTWIAKVSSNPKDYVKDLQNPGKGSWQSAASLADILRNPRNEHLKRDTVLAKQLAEVLQQQLDRKNYSENAIKLRIFLCRTLGEFHVDDGLPVLIQAATQERQPEEVAVRQAAIEAISVLADNTDPAAIQREARLLPAILAAARDVPTDGEDPAIRGDLRARAAFALGVLGSVQARDELARLCGDAYANARYNAATGLARQGDLRSVPVLLQMLDPDNQDAVADETNKQGIAWKQALVLVNGLNAAERLSEHHRQAELAEVRAAVHRLIDAPLDPKIAGRIHTLAKEVEQRFD